MPAFRRIRAATRGLIAAPWTLASLSLFARRRQGSRCVIIAGRPPHCLENQAKTLDIVVSLIEGALENSPALQCWERRGVEKKGTVPEGRLKQAGVCFSRPSGTDSG